MAMLFGEEALRSFALRFTFTPKESCVLFALAEGKSNKEIAQEAGCSPGTIKTHMRNIYRKTGVHSITKLWVMVKEFTNTNA